MKKTTLKRLALCRAFEVEFGTDTYSVQEAITEETDEYEEWQEFREENENYIERLKDKLLLWLDK